MLGAAAFAIVQIVDTLYIARKSVLKLSAVPVHLFPAGQARCK